MKLGKIVVLLLVITAIGAFFLFDISQYFNLAFLKSSRQLFENYYHANPIQTLAIFFAIYVALTALSLPGAAVLTLAAGALFGLFVGTLIASFASAIGATLAFLISRYLLRDWIKNHFGRKLAAIDVGIEREGTFYLF